MNNKTSVDNTALNVNKESFGVIYQSSFTWCKKQKPCVMVLWIESWEIDPFGDRWVELKTSLPTSTFRQARNVLRDAGMFEFKSETSNEDGRKTSRWLVRNLKGSKSDFTKKQRKISSSKRRIKYHKFLRSKYWQEVRDLVFTRDNHTCVKCGATKDLQVHHLTYEHHRHEKEHIEDLITLCKSCHSSIHGH